MISTFGTFYKFCTYRKTVKSMNISFTKLGEEECEVCMSSKQHEHDNDPASCTICKEIKIHEEKQGLISGGYGKTA